MLFRRSLVVSIVTLVNITVAQAQIDPRFPLSQPELLRQPPSAQGQILAQSILKAAPDKNGCANPQASFRKAFSEGSGGWLVRCSNTTDFWVVVPPEAGKGASILSCPMMQALMGRDCHTIR